MRVRLLKYVFIALGVLYLLAPADLIADYFGWFGRLDDIGVLIFLCLQYRKWRRVLEQSSQRSGKEPPREDEQASVKGERGAPADPYTVLGVPRGASWEEVQRGYRELATKYHPDRVAHLGEELRVLAHEKMIEIQAAYEELKRFQPKERAK